MNRTRDYYRKMRKKWIQKRRKMDEALYNGDGHWYSVNGKYSKGKIHCSCYMCSAKTNVRGWKISDQRKIDRANYDLNKINI